MANKNLRNISKVSNINNDVAFNKLQNELKEKSKMLNKEFAEKEELIKNKYLNEIANTTKKIDELKIDNENLNDIKSKIKSDYRIFNPCYQREEIKNLFKIIKPFFSSV